MLCLFTKFLPDTKNTVYPITFWKCIYINILPVYPTGDVYDLTIKEQQIPDFKDLWDRIKDTTIYLVDFDRNK